MPQISQYEFARLPLRVHHFLADVRLHDVWAVDLPKTRGGITLDEFFRIPSMRHFSQPTVVRALFAFRLAVGRLLKWEEPGPEAIASGTASGAFADRLTEADRAVSLLPAGTREAPDPMFRVVYRFPNEHLGEIANRTVHGAALSALVETPTRYRFYFAVFVRSVHPLTPLYMAAIAPFRKHLVYPALLASVHEKWTDAMTT